MVGRVVGRSGEPLPETILYFEPGDRVLEDFDYAITDASGNYSVHLLSGMYRVEVDPPIEHGLMSRMELITVSPNDNRVDFAFLGYRVTGRVVDPTGALLDSGRVDVRPQAPVYGYATSPLQEGSYSLLLPAGMYSFQAIHASSWSGFTPEWQESVKIAGDTTIDLHLDGISVSGRVLGPDGLPMKDAAVEARVNNSFIRNRTGVDGRYQLYVPSGTYRLRFGPPYPFYIIPRFVGPLTIHLPTSIDGDLSGVEWRGTVRRGTEPALGIIVTVRMIDDPDERGAAIYVGPQGEFRFVMEPNRRYDLETYDPASGERVAVRGATATADTTFEILIPPPTVP